MTDPDDDPRDPELEADRAADAYEDWLDYLATHDRPGPAEWYWGDERRDR